MGGAEAAPGEAILNAAGIPTFPFPDEAVRAFLLMAKYSYNLKGIYETPMQVEDRTAPNTQPEVSAGLAAIREQGRTILTEFEAKELFKAYGIPVVETRIASTSAEAVAQAKAIGFPVVVKLHSETITHKTDVGGVQLNLGDETAVERAYQAIQESVTAKAGAEHFEGVTVQKMVRSSGAYELILGSSIDSQFGPVILFGAGGQLVGGISRPVAGHPSAQYDAGAQVDGADAYLQGIARSARPQAGRSRQTGAAAGSLQPTGNGTAMD